MTALDTTNFQRERQMFTEEQQTEVIDLTSPIQPFDLTLPQFEECHTCRLQIFTTTDGISYTDLFVPVHTYDGNKYCGDCFFRLLAEQKASQDWANFLKAHSAMEEEVAKGPEEEMDLAILDLPAEILTNMSLVD
jgi:hypothetical protein